VQPAGRNLRVSRAQLGEATNGGMALAGFILGIVGLCLQTLAAMAIAFGP